MVKAWSMFLTDDITEQMIEHTKNKAVIVYAQRNAENHENITEFKASG